MPKKVKDFGYYQVPGLCNSVPIAANSWKRSIGRPTSSGLLPEHVKLCLILSLVAVSLAVGFKSLCLKHMGAVSFHSVLLGVVQGNSFHSARFDFPTA